MDTRKPLVIALMAVLALPPALARAEGEGKADLPLRRVVLFTSGVGYFQRDGVVKGNARLELRFDAENINDLLKSVVLRDFDGGRVSSVTYGSRDPITKALHSFAIDLTEMPTLAEILAQVRGERVELSAPGPIEGTIVGVERRLVPAAGEGREPYETVFLNLLTEKGLTSVALSQVLSVRFARAELQSELRQALATVAMGHDTEKKPVAFEFQGEGERRVSVAYIAESPVWKTSYRLVLQDDKPPFLQGWAIVENTTDEDWTGIGLTLVSGRPVSFIMDLYEPLYVERPVVTLDLGKGLRPRKYEEAMEKSLEEEDSESGAAPPSAPGAGAVRGRARLKDARKSAEDRPGSDGMRFGAAAQGGEVGELFQYEIENPVTLPRRQSALLPIVSADVGGKKLSIYNEATHAQHPYNGLRLKNTSGQSLMQGPITVFDGGTYAGDAQIDDLNPDGERLLSYALDLDLEVEATGAMAPENVLSMRLYRGALILTREQRRDREYRVKHRGKKARHLLIEHPYDAAWTLLSPAAPEERTRDFYRFALDIEPGKSAALKVSEQRRVDQSISLSNLRGDAIEVYLRSKTASPAVEAALTRMVASKNALAETAAVLARLDARAKEIAAEQDRIRQNLARLTENSPLHARYVQTLTAQEDELEGLRKDTAQNRDKLATQQKALDDMLLALDVS